MIRYTIKLRIGARLTLPLLFLMAIGIVGIYGIERANAGAEQQYRDDVVTWVNSATGSISPIPVHVPLLYMLSSSDCRKHNRGMAKSARRVG